MKRNYFSWTFNRWRCSQSHPPWQKRLCWYKIARDVAVRTVMKLTNTSDRWRGLKILGDISTVRWKWLCWERRNLQLNELLCFSKAIDGVDRLSSEVDKDINRWRGKKCFDDISTDGVIKTSMLIENLQANALLYISKSIDGVDRSSGYKIKVYSFSI